MLSRDCARSCERTQTFRLLDTDGDGQLSRAEVRQLFARLNLQTTDRDIEYMFDELGGKITFEAFYGMLGEALANRQPAQIVAEVFETLQVRSC